MTVRGTVRAANDRGAWRAENRVLFEAPKEKDHSTEWSFSFALNISLTCDFTFYCNIASFYSF